MVAIPSPNAVLLASLAHRVWLRDATAIDVRPIQQDDGDRLRRFHARLSPSSIRMRYFHVVPFLSDAMVATFTHVDYVDRMALVATVDGTGADNASGTARQEIVSLVNYERISSDTAEVAFLVEDAWQGKGIATTLLYDLAAYARTCGFRYFLAIMLYRNAPMLNLLTQCGFPSTLHEPGDDEVAVRLDITAAPVCRFTHVARTAR